MASATVENYVKQILLLREASEAGTVAGKPSPVPLGKLSVRMNVSPGTVTTMAKNMARDGLLHYRTRAGVVLTPKGERLALQVLRKHRLVEMFLVSTLQFDMSEVHAEAELLEHAISEKLLARIDDFLGRPQFDPHGDAIPGADGKMPHRKLCLLSECAAGDRIRISRIQQQDDAFLRYVLDAGLMPGVALTIESADLPADAFSVVFDDGRRLTLGGKAASGIQTTAEVSRKNVEKPAPASAKPSPDKNLSGSILLNMNEIKLY